MSIDLKSANSVKTGKKFSELRKELNYSIDDISKTLFINKDYIIAIEEGNYSIFPSEAFARAYFQKYKDFLNIKRDFPSIYDENKDSQHKKIKREIKLPYILDKKTKKVILASLVILLGIFIFYTISVFINFESQENESQVNESQVNESQVNESQVSESQVSESQVNESQAVESKYELDSNSSKPNEAKLNKNVILLMPTNENNKINQRLLELTFIGECWIELYVNNVLVEAQQFSDGDTYIKETIAPFKIVVGNADLVKGSYNGETIDFINNINLVNGVSTVSFNND
jgi:cytoskeletal protein RodZ